MLAKGVMMNDIRTTLGWSILAVMMVWGPLSLPVEAQNQLIFTDHFDDGILDPAWQVAFEGLDGLAIVNGWDFDESVTQASYLTVRDITGANSGVGDWRQVILRRTVPPLGDFHVAMRIAWNSPLAANGRLTVSARDGDSNPLVTRAGFADFWGNDFGTRHMDFPPCGGALCSVPSSLPETGSALVEIDRTGNTFTFMWDGSTIFSTTIGTQAAEKIELAFLFFRWDSHWSDGHIIHRLHHR
jgi:hypothetical protein